MRLQRQEIQTMLAIACRALQDTEAKDWSVKELRDVYPLLHDSIEYVEDLFDAKNAPIYTVSGAGATQAGADTGKG